MMTLFETPEKTGVYTVSQLNTQIKKLLESNYPYIWVKGEISNFRVPASGHFYFTLKDEQSQIRAVFFRPQQRYLRFEPEAGLQVLCQGRLSVYEPRGEYQLIVELMEPQGLGALQLAFEQLKKKLEKEGLFDPAQKRPLPVFPQRIAVITSATGAAVRDILKVFERSPYPLAVTLLPVRVQGEEAPKEIAASIATANDLAEHFKWDVILVGRGGGSIEDLWAFNEEIVARAVAASRIPIISAVGHEIDFTISDMVADLRAPTPTAAAEWVIAQLESLQRDLSSHKDRMLRSVTQTLGEYAQRLGFLEKRMRDPKRRLEDLRLFVDDRLDRLQTVFSHQFERLRTRLSHLGEKLRFHHPLKNIRQQQAFLRQQTRELSFHHRKILDRYQFELQKYGSQLESLNPLAVLARGYSITYRLPDEKIVYGSDEVKIDETVRVRLLKGSLECVVRRIE